MIEFSYLEIGALALTTICTSFIAGYLIGFVKLEREEKTKNINSNPTLENDINFLHTMLKK